MTSMSTRTGSDTRRMASGTAPADLAGGRVVRARAAPVRLAIGCTRTSSRSRASREGEARDDFESRGGAGELVEDADADDDAATPDAGRGGAVGGGDDEFGVGAGRQGEGRGEQGPEHTPNGSEEGGAIASRAVVPIGHARPYRSLPVHRPRLLARRRRRELRGVERRAGRDDERDDGQWFERGRAADLGWVGGGVDERAGHYDGGPLDDERDVGGGDDGDVDR